ncbi:hypothetical protein DEIPH_ctg084orf0031 [Deinococcus phoenicis]|uniref:Lipoprotein n=1 Tax=Deinococcus phoenicis TaxID=1476583 RepID=A0A016QLH8_9DEIO|nr:hypothetical protein [Deinococcus phoenicis]EYB66614.1 hypothetical protein DEIPH_ctg084orf0031 [Deinococcus phoenicis]
MARFPLAALACLSLLTLSACSLTSSRPTTFAAGQNWLAQGYDGGQLTSAEVATGRFSTYDMDRSDVPAGSEKARVKVRSNLNPVMALRLLFPGGTPMLVQTVSTGQTDFLWNAGTAGVMYRCRVQTGDVNVTYISGDLVRVDQGREVPLGSCGVRRR